MSLKSERLKKFENELLDLEQWSKLGLVPKKDLEKHVEEIQAVKDKIEDEKARLLFLKESGESEEYVAPKRAPQARQAYQEPSMPGMDIADEGMTDAGLDMETENYESEASADAGDDADDDQTVVEEEEEDPFSEKNRWKRGVWEDPDNPEW